MARSGPSYGAAAPPLPPPPGGNRLPVRPAPLPPKPQSLTLLNNVSEFDLFSRTAMAPGNQRKKPPPRPPPPKFNRNALTKPELPTRPTHFNRKPTVLTSLMARRKLPEENGPVNFQSFLPPRNEPECNVASLIDLSSPSSSPTLTTRSSSDGLSVDSFGSDVTSSTSNANHNGESLSQAESGFEDDFDPFSPPKNKKKGAKPVYDSDFLDPLCNGKTIVTNVPILSAPTIIRAKPTRPKAPKNSMLLSMMLTNDDLQTLIQPKPIQHYDDYIEEYSPPMPSVPPPPPPVIDEADLKGSDEVDELKLAELDLYCEEEEEPFAIALYDFPGEHSDDLSFEVGNKIRLLRKMNDEWYYGKLRSGIEGIFPKSFVEIKVPLEKTERVEPQNWVTALFDFIPQEAGDLGLTAGCKVNVLAKFNESWLYGEVDGHCGQFPSNYVDRIPDGLPLKSS